jgi:hypothetical protein
MNQKTRPRWMLVLLAVIAVMAVGAIVVDDDTKSARTATEQRARVASDAPARTIEAARAAVDGDDYAAAIRIATAIGAMEADAVRKRIADRLARRTLTALRAGDRGRARTLLAEADDYPTTTRMRHARAGYEAAKARAKQRRHQRRRAAARDELG